MQCFLFELLFLFRFSLVWLLYWVFLFSRTGFGLVCFGLVWFGLVWFGLVWFSFILVVILGQYTD